MFSRLPIRSKLLAGFLFMALLAAVAGYIGIASERRVARLFAELVTGDIPRNRALLEMKRIASEIASHTITFNLIGEETAQAEGSLAARKKFELLASIEKLEKWEEEYRRLTPGASGGSWFLQRVSTARERVVSLAIEVIDLKEQGRANEEVKAKEEQLRAAQVDLAHIIDQTLTIDSEALHTRWRNTGHTAAQATRGSLLISLTAVLLAFAFGITIARVIATPLAALQTTALQIASGQLDRRVIVASRDEVGRLGVAFNDMADRTSALIELVRRSSAESERANHAKSEFLSRMSHELRTPLNAILGFAQLLEMDALSAEQRDSVEQILQGGRHLLELINEVLDISRIETGRLSVAVEPVALQPVVRESLELIGPLAASRGIYVNGRPALTYSGYVSADRQRLKQVLLNLLTNAVKYNRDGGTVTLSLDAPTLDRLRIVVRDNGPGIPREMQPRLFLPFERLGAERSGVEGTGIGLALSKSLTELMGGRIGAESEPGQGSTFWVELSTALDPAPQGRSAVLSGP